jgi:hypothetical protein
MNKKQLLFTLVVAPVVGFLALVLLMVSYDSGIIQGSVLGFVWLALVVGSYWWFLVRCYKRLGD